MNTCRSCKWFKPAKSANGKVVHLEAFGECVFGWVLERKNVLGTWPNARVVSPDDIACSEFDRKHRKV